MFINSLFTLIFISVLVISSFAFGNETYTKPKFKHINLLNYGSCQYEKGTVDLSKALYLQNTSLSYFSENTGKIFYLGGDKVYVQKDKSDNTKVFSIVDFIEEHYKLVNPDIDLSFVLINNELSIYWKETYLHRAYRQGIVAIRKDTIVAVCDGFGGFDSSH